MRGKWIFATILFVSLFVVQAVWAQDGDEIRERYEAASRALNSDKGSFGSEEFTALEEEYKESRDLYGNYLFTKIMTIDKLMSEGSLGYEQLGLLALEQENTRSEAQFFLDTSRIRLTVLDDTFSFNLSLYIGAKILSGETTLTDKALTNYTGDDTNSSVGTGDSFFDGDAEGGMNMRVGTGFTFRVFDVFLIESMFSYISTSTGVQTYNGSGFFSEDSKVEIVRSRMLFNLLLGYSIPVSRFNEIYIKGGPILSLNSDSEIKYPMGTKSLTSGESLAYGVEGNVGFHRMFSDMIGLYIGLDAVYMFTSHNDLNNLFGTGSFNDTTKEMVISLDLGIKSYLF